MKKRSYLMCLEDTQQSMSRISEYIEDLDLIAFKRDYKTVDAVIRNFEKIGEASKVETVPDNPSGTRSISIENRFLGKSEWNTYDVVYVDGTIKLSVNEKFVNGSKKSSKRSGYICLEPEGAEIHFRNLSIVELP